MLYIKSFKMVFIFKYLKVIKDFNLKYLKHIYIQNIKNKVFLLKIKQYRLYFFPVLIKKIKVPI